MNFLMLYSLTRSIKDLFGSLIRLHNGQEVEAIRGGKKIFLSFTYNLDFNFSSVSMK